MKTSNRNGYLITYLPDHPSAYGDGYVYVHRLVAEETLGRALLDNEEVHHKNENKHDNTPDNLEVLAKGVHTAHHNGGALHEIPCGYCGTRFRPSDRKVKCCSNSCGGLLRNQSRRPSREVLRELVWRIPSTNVAKLYAVSGSAIKKWCRAYGIQKPPRGYWAKKYAGK